jgi:hypothetical protein
MTEWLLNLIAQAAEQDEAAGMQVILNLEHKYSFIFQNKSM